VAPQVVPVLLPLVHAISSIRVFVAKDLKNADNRKAAAKSVAEVSYRMSEMNQSKAIRQLLQPSYSFSLFTQNDNFGYGAIILPLFSTNYLPTVLYFSLYFYCRESFVRLSFAPHFARFDHICPLSRSL
jgi:hypothetical protein